MEASDQQKNLSKYNIILCLDNKNCEIHVLKFVLKRKLRGKEMMNRIYKNPRRLIHCHRERRLKIVESPNDKSKDGKKMKGVSGNRFLSIVER